MTIHALYESWVAGNLNDTAERLEKASPDYIARFINHMHQIGEADEADLVCRKLYRRAQHASAHAAQYGQADTSDLA